MMIRKILSFITLVGILAGCEGSGIKPAAFPDQSGNKKGPGLFSKNDDGFVIKLDDIINEMQDDKKAPEEDKKVNPDF